MSAAARTVVWLARAAWLAVAIAGGAAIGEALDDRARAVQVAGTLAAWAGWAVGAIALAIPSVLTLTLARATVPASLVVAALTLIDGVGAVQAISLLAPALAASALVATAEFGRVYIQASAYGAEARFGLRPPIGYLVPCVATWLVTITAVILAVPALAGSAWVLGALSIIVAAGGLAALPRRWHQLSRRVARARAGGHRRSRPRCPRRHPDAAATHRRDGRPRRPPHAHPCRRPHGADAWTRRGADAARGGDRRAGSDAGAPRGHPRSGVRRRRVADAPRRRDHGDHRRGLRHWLNARPAVALTWCRIG